MRALRTGVERCEIFRPTSAHEATLPTAAIRNSPPALVRLSVPHGLAGWKASRPCALTGLDASHPAKPCEPLNSPYRRNEFNGSHLHLGAVNANLADRQRQVEAPGSATPGVDIQNAVSEFNQRFV